MIVNKTATLLTADSKPYNVNGNEGVSHKARFLIEGEIYSLTATEQLVKELKARIADENQEGEAEIEFTSRKENLKAELVSFQ